MKNFKDFKNDISTITDMLSYRMTFIFLVISIIFLFICIMLNDKYTTAKTQIEEDTKNYNNLIASYTDAQTEINELKETKLELQETKLELTLSQEELNNQISELKTDNVEITNQNTELELENKEIVDSYIEAIQTRYKYTAQDYEYLLRMAETETYGADMMSRSHVISVAINRANAYGMSPYAVITSPNQFVYSNTKITQTSIDALEYVLYNGDTAQGALYFYSGGSGASSWQGRSLKFTDSVGHHFY